MRCGGRREGRLIVLLGCSCEAGWGRSRNQLKFVRVPARLKLLFSNIVDGLNNKLVSTNDDADIP